MKISTLATLTISRVLASQALAGPLKEAKINRIVNDVKVVEPLLRTLNDAYLKKDADAMKRLMSDDHIAILQTPARAGDRINNAGDFHILATGRFFDHPPHLAVTEQRNFHNWGLGVGGR